MFGFHPVQKCGTAGRRQTCRATRSKNGWCGQLPLSRTTMRRQLTTTEAANAAVLGGTSKGSTFCSTCSPPRRRQQSWGRGEVPGQTYTRARGTKVSRPPTPTRSAPSAYPNSPPVSSASGAAKPHDDLYGFGVCDTSTTATGRNSGTVRHRRPARRTTRSSRVPAGGVRQWSRGDFCCAPDARLWHVETTSNTVARPPHARHHSDPSDKFRSVAIPTPST